MNKEFTIQEPESGQRLDIFCVSRFPEQSRAVIQRAIKQGNITVNEKMVKPRYIIKANDNIAVILPEAIPTEDTAETGPIKIPIIHEDKNVVVINKPAGLVTHPGVGKESQSVASWFAERYPNSADVGDPERPGIVHRLDKDTSGVMILAKTKPAFAHLKERFKKQHPRKEYLALVYGTPGESKGRITRPLSRSRRNPMRRAVDENGKPAITEWVKEETLGKYSLLRVYPLTGRTHQIRVHLHFLGFPIVGDALYTFKRQKPPQGVTKQLLHAEKLTLVLPNGKRKTFTAPLPEDFQQVLVSLRGESPPL